MLDFTKPFSEIYSTVKNDTTGRDFFNEIAATLNMSRQELLDDLEVPTICSAIGYAQEILSAI